MSVLADSRSGVFWQYLAVDGILSVQAVPGKPLHRRSPEEEDVLKAKGLFQPSALQGVDDGEAAHIEPVTVRTRRTVCHVLHSLTIGGAESLAMALATRHADEFRTVFALLDEVGALGEVLRGEGYQVAHLGRRQGFDLRCVRRLGSYFRDENVALIHAHQYGPLFYSALARLFSYRAPILFQEHGRDYPDYRRTKRVIANRMLLSRQDHFVAVGEAVREALVRFEGLHRNRIEVIYNGIDLAQFDPDRPGRSLVRQEIGLGKGDFVIIQVARLNRLKDHSTALRALQVLRATVPGAHLVLVGEGEERETLERETAGLGLSPYVHFLGVRSDVPRLLHGADTFLLSSISEGIPLTLIEAMATALPCVSTSVGGVPEVVVDGETGLLAPARDANSLAAHLTLLAADQALRTRLGRAGRSQAESHFDAGAMHARYRALYRSMLRMV